MDFEAAIFDASLPDRDVSGVRVYEDRFEWLLNLNPDACGELDDAGSPFISRR